MQIVEMILLEQSFLPQKQEGNIIQILLPMKSTLRTQT